MKFGVRELNISIVCLGAAVITYFSLHQPHTWGVFLIYAPLASIVIFDFGRAKGIDSAYASVKHMKDLSAEANMVLYFLSAQRVKTTVIRLISLKHQHPQESESIDAAINSLKSYLKTKPWWHGS
jgi:hypothetical protein